MSLRCCVIIPAYNAAKTVGALIEGVKRHQLDVIVIDDGSKDATARIATDSGAVVISHLSNTGKGSALRTGFAYVLRSTYDAVITMDSDGQHDPAEIRRFVELAEQEGAAIVVGNRLDAADRMPLVRRVVNRLMSWLISRMTGQRIPDSQCGFRLIRRHVLAESRLVSSRFELETELLLTAGRHAWSIRPLPIQAIYPRDLRSSIQPLLDGLRFVWMVARHLASRRNSRDSQR